MKKYNVTAMVGLNFEVEASNKTEARNKMLETLEKIKEFANFYLESNDIVLKKGK